MGTVGACVSGASPVPGNLCCLNCDHPFLLKPPKVMEVQYFICPNTILQPVICLNSSWRVS